MVDVRVTFGAGAPSKQDQARIESIAKQRIEAFFGEERVRDVLKVPKTLDLDVGKNEVSATLPGGAVFAMTVEQICAEFEKLIQELKNI